MGKGAPASKAATNVPTKVMRSKESIAKSEMLKVRPRKGEAGCPLRPEMLPHHNWFLCHTQKGLDAARKLMAAHPRSTMLPQSQWPAGVKPVSVPRPGWLPMNFAFGIKTTCKCPLKAYISPWKKMYYHRDVIEQILGKQLGPGDGLEGAKRWAKEQLEKGFGWRGPYKFNHDDKLLALLTKSEKAHLPDVSAFHFAVISARRADVREGIMRCMNIEAMLRAAGAEPVWYVDEKSVQSYRRLGLNAVKGGGLCEARNLALADAAKKKKACVQLSDDIIAFNYYHSKEVCKDMFEGNAAAKRAQKLRLSPVAAARYLLARMRASPKKPKLGGVFPLGNSGMALGHVPLGTENFILGDFFVHDGSPCRFDTKLRLKEDYDFTASHLDKHGSVLRCNRLLLSVVHERNEGGACSERDAAGERERESIRHLQEKWPGVFCKNGSRGDTQVVMSWRRRKS
mmetsp:Transcript_149075/g.478804  ORF Transcript_149075/g.478804 Transcript_149075/m.478804 type:complete len:455 (-) Transcript_149075:95-1459(-)